MTARTGSRTDRPMNSLTASDQREILYANDPTAYSRATTKRHYPTRGALVAECFARYADGGLDYLINNSYTS